MKALVTGATGLIGRSLVREFEEVNVLSRDPSRARSSLGNVAAFAWQPEHELPPAEAFEGVDVVFHLAGESVLGSRWTTDKKRAIYDSRVKGVSNLLQALEPLDKRPSVLVCASSLGFYGDRGDEELIESSPPGGLSFPSKVCMALEAEAIKAKDLGLRVVIARIGIVLAPHGETLALMLVPFRMGLGGPLSGGGQWFSWIHLEDTKGMLLYAARTDTIEGPVNVVSPHPETNRSLSKTIGQLLRRPAILPIPRFALRMVFGEMSEVFTASARILPKAAQDAGYRFRYERLRDALGACLEQMNQKKS